MNKCTACLPAYCVKSKTPRDGGGVRWDGYTFSGFHAGGGRKSSCTNPQLVPTASQLLLCSFGLQHTCDIIVTSSVCHPWIFPLIVLTCVMAAKGVSSG